MVHFHLCLSRCSMRNLETCTYIISIIIIIIIIIHYLNLAKNCKGLQTAHQGLFYDDISIGLGLGAAWGAWKHAPIILMPRHNALIQACPPYF